MILVIATHNSIDSTDSTYTTDSTPFILDVWTYSRLRMSLRVPACPGRALLLTIRPPPASYMAIRVAARWPILALSTTPVVIAIIMPRLGIDSILRRLAHFLSRISQ
ncbi:hypothetical protein DY000_02002630 [Brassica cretica]|uniref:Uncharacterized protein n=1 Tax=Brassica cretica TaxID=69181 RepID=A0ABQ7BSN5_BRACR|nr:hypothetical protein DY000_02002630 [Brassica cretica]